MNGMPNGFNVDFFEAAGIEPVVTMTSTPGMEADHDDDAAHVEDADDHMEDAAHDEDADDHMEDAGHDEDGDDHMEVEDAAHDEDTAHDDDAAHDDDGDDHMDHSSFMVSIDAGSEMTHSITFTVTEEMIGDWEIGCFLLQGVHYTSGMTGTLTITG
jgi:hypothetical protein